LLGSSVDQSFVAFATERSLYGTELDPRRFQFCFSTAAILLLTVIAVRYATLSGLGSLVNTAVVLTAGASFVGMFGIVEEYHFQAVGPKTYVQRN
jgi:hypothetical protein